MVGDLKNQEKKTKKTFIKINKNSFHDNKHKIVRKSIYYGKYYIDKVIFYLTKKYDRIRIR